MAVGKKTGGRIKGTPNRATAAKAAEIAATGLAPLDYMLSVLRDAARSDAERFEAAKQAAPYCHPKLSTVDASLDGDVTFTVVINKPADAD